MHDCLAAHSGMRTSPAPPAYVLNLSPAWPCRWTSTASRTRWASRHATCGCWTPTSPPPTTPPSWHATRCAAIMAEGMGGREWVCVLSRAAHAAPVAIITRVVLCQCLEAGVCEVASDLSP